MHEEDRSFSKTCKKQHPVQENLSFIDLNEEIPPKPRRSQEEKEDNVNVIRWFLEDLSRSVLKFPVLYSFKVTNVTSRIIFLIGSYLACLRNYQERFMIEPGLWQTGYAT